MSDEAPAPDSRPGADKAPAGEKRPGSERRAPRRGGPEARLRGLARRLFRELEHEPTEPHDEGSERGPASGRPTDNDDPSAPPPAGGRSELLSLLGAILETGDKAKTEMVRMTAREVRNYLEALELHKDLHHLITNHSLEVHASIHLKPLDPAAPAPAPAAKVGLRPLDPSDDAGD